MREIERLERQTLAQRNKITSMEKKMQAIFDEYSGLLESLVEMVSCHYAGQMDPNVLDRAERLINQMRKKYG